MSVKGNIKREKLFEKFSKNFYFVANSRHFKLRGYDGQGNIVPLDSIYFCPLCFRPFDKGALNQNVDEPLTLEDVPPQFLGGKPLILTCRTCNNGSEGNLESYLKRYLDQEVFSRIPGYIEINKKKAKARVHLGKDERKFTVDIFGKMEKNPIFKKELNYLEEHGEGSEIKSTFQFIKKRGKPAICLLKIAYFLMFSTFGYGFIFNKSIFKVRKYILEIDNSIIPNLNTSDKLEEGIYIIKGPKQFKSYLVNFRAKKYSRNFSVIIPGPEQSDFNIYNILKNNCLNKIQKFDFIKIKNSNYLTEKNNILAYTNLWNNVF